MRNTTGGNGLPRVPRRSGVAGLYAVPRLEELVADPDKLGVLDPRTRRALTTTALTALNTLMFNELALAAEPSGSISLDRRDRLLDFKQAAEKLGVTADWLYHNYKDFPFWVRVGRRPRFSENGIEDYIQKRRNT
jgi:predicted DNA-binding transcriptional regulator AlpA